MKRNKRNAFDVLSSKFAGTSSVSFEWSLKISRDYARVRDKVICWINNRDNRAHLELTSMHQVLTAFRCPLPILHGLQEIPLEAVVNMGFGFSSSGKEDYCIYLHYHEGDIRGNRYAAFPWPDHDNKGKLVYEFFYLPMTPDGDTPDTWIHPQLIPAYRRLLKNPRLTGMSGFWLRKNDQRVDQISLTYSWQPPVQEFLEDLSLFSESPRLKEEIRKYKTHHLRHIAFTGGPSSPPSSTPSSPPSITLYFTSNVAGEMPGDIKELQRVVKERAKRHHKIIEEHLFRGLSITETKKDRQLDRFYSTDVTPVWRQMLGKNMYYHFGMFHPEDNVKQDIWNDKPFERAVQDLMEFIAPGSSVYDMGCGWGGAARYLVRKRGCRVVGITISGTQYEYCHSAGIQTRYGDMEHTIPPGCFDNLLLLESFEHVKDKYALLKKLHSFGERLIIRMSCQDSRNAHNIVFGGSMVMVSSTQLEKLVKAAGWKIIHWKNRRAESMPSIDIWNARMKTIPKQRDFHFETWRTYCEKIKLYSKVWAESHPLIEVVAE